MAKCQAVAQELGGQLFLADWVACTIAEMALGKGRAEQALSMAEQAVAMAQKIGGIWVKAWHIRCGGNHLPH